VNESVIISFSHKKVYNGKEERDMAETGKSKVMSQSSGRDDACTHVHVQYCNMYFSKR
jgi:hypothetical protein